MSDLHPIPIRERSSHIYGTSAASHEGKRSYLTVGRAYIAALRIASILHDSPNRPDEIAMYRCDMCFAYHVGTVGGDPALREERREERAERAARSERPLRVHTKPLPKRFRTKGGRGLHPV